MKSRARILFRTATIALICSALWLSAVHVQEWDPYLKGYHGPYRGRVIDAETKQPIAGAVVVAIWVSMKEESSSAIPVFYDAREAVSGSSGEFLLHAEDIERRAPSQTFRPTFLIFFPGYGSFPDYHLAPHGSLGDIFEQAGATVELPRLKTAADRLRVLGGLPPGISDQKIPNLRRLSDIERANLKLAPSQPSGEK